MASIKTLNAGVAAAAAMSCWSYLPAAAQDAPDEAESRQQTITVTAQKREQSLQEVAGSIAAFDAATIETRGLNEVENLSQSVPGLIYNETNGASQISIRGVGLLVNTGVAEANVATHIDGIFQGRASASTLAFLDAERVEVLRGPQGTLYGRNATGGSVNFILAKPTEEFEGALEAGFGSYSAYHVKGMLSGPIAGDAVSGRIAAVYRESDGYYDNITTGDDELGLKNFGIRGALRFVPSDDLTIDFSAWHINQESDTPVQNLVRGISPLVAGLEAGMVLPPGLVAITSDPFQTAGETPPSSETETTSVTLDVNWDFGANVSLRSLTGYSDHTLGPQIFDGDGTSLGIVNVGEPGNPRLGEATAISQEFNLFGEAFDGDLDWLVGAYYYNEDHDHTIPTPFPSPIIQAVLGAGFAGTFGPGTLFQGQTPIIDEETESQAIFADMTWSLSDRFRINFGARYSDDTKDISQTVTSDIVAAGVMPLTLPLCTDLQTKQSFSETNVKVRGEFDLTDNSLVYGQFQNGFKDGGVNLSTCGDTFSKEQIDAFEIGAKSTFANGNVILNASAFSYDYRDLQVLAFRNNLSFVDSVPEASMMGAEVELTVRANDNLSFDAGVSLLDGEIEEFVSFDEANPTAGNQDLSGNALPSAPDYTFIIGANYNFDTSLGAFDLRAEYFQSAEYEFRPFNNPDEKQDSYGLLNLYADFTPPSENYRLSAFVKNATDEEYLNFLLFSSVVGIAGEYAPPQTWGIELGVNF